MYVSGEEPGHFRSSKVTPLRKRRPAGDVVTAFDPATGRGHDLSREARYGARWLNVICGREVEWTAPAFLINPKRGCDSQLLNDRLRKHCEGRRARFSDSARRNKPLYATTWVADPWLSC